MELIRDVLSPAAYGQNLALEMQFEEELVDDVSQSFILEQTERDRDLNVRSVNVQLEYHKVLLASNLVKETSNGLLLLGLMHDRCIVKVIVRHQTGRNVIPKLDRIQVSILPSIDLIEYNLALEWYRDMGK